MIKEHQALRFVREGVMQCRELQLDMGKRTLIMGIVNTTPDSFSDGGTSYTVDDALHKIERMIEAGVDIIDIGGESTRPGAEKVSVDEELRRVVPLVEAVHKRAWSIPISIDTYKSEVAEQALEAGAHIINDVWGLLEDPRIAEVAARFSCPLILTHNRKTIARYDHVAAEVCADLQKQIEVARAAGVREAHIILDPGIGFAKQLTDNLLMMKHLDQLVALGYPVLLGTSRKSMIQKTLGLPANEVLAGTLSTLVLGIAQGCHILRVHDVEDALKAAKMADAIVRQEG